MASSSSGKRIRPCSNTKCSRAIDVTRPGWKFLDQQVMLCNQCYVAYMKKQFCYIYHKNSTSWSFYKFCNKKIHRPCLVSLDWYIILEDGGIKCNECGLQEALVPSFQETMHGSTNTLTLPQTQVENKELIIDKACSRTSRYGLYRYTPRMTGEELNDIFKGLNAQVSPLFEKVLSATDTGRGGRLVLPRSCAEEFFPTVDDDQCHPIEIQDSEGKVWDFNLRMWSHNKSKMYVLEGFEPYVRSKKLVVGDTVTFSRLIPDGNLVIANRKGATCSSQENDPEPSENRSKGKRPLTTSNESVVPRVQSGIVISKGGVASKRRSCFIGLRVKGTEKKNKGLATVERGPETIDSPRGINVPFDVVEKVFERRHKKDNSKASTSKPPRKYRTKSTTGNTKPTVGNLEPGPSEQRAPDVTRIPCVGDTVTFSRLIPEGQLVIANRKRAASSSQENVPEPREDHSKGKRPLTTRNESVVTRVQSGIVISEGGVASKRRSCVIGLQVKGTEKKNKGLATVERRPETVDSPRGSNVPSNVVEKVFERRHKKDNSKASTSKPGRNYMTKSTTGNSKPTVGNLEPGPSEQRAPNVTRIPCVVALAVPPRWIRKHTCHRISCTCVLCMPRARRSRAQLNLSCQPPSHGAETSNTTQVEPGSSNRGGQMNDSSNAVDNQNLNSVSGSRSRGLIIDLNALPEPEEELLDSTNDVQERSTAGEM